MISKMVASFVVVVKNGLGKGAKYKSFLCKNWSSKKKKDKSKTNQRKKNQNSQVASREMVCLFVSTLKKNF